MDFRKYLFEINDNNSARFILGQIEQEDPRPILCIGVNPHTGEPGNLESTTKSIKKISEHNNFNSWIMANLYPARSKNVESLPDLIDCQLHWENLLSIEKILTKHSNIPILCAWGQELYKKPYFIRCLVDIVTLLRTSNSLFYCIGKTKFGHPVHPSRKSSATSFLSFDIKGYF